MLRTLGTRIATGVVATTSACMGLGGVAGASAVNVNVHTMGPSSPVHVVLGGYGHGSGYSGSYQHHDSDWDKHQDKDWNKHDKDKTYEHKQVKHVSYNNDKHDYKPAMYVVHKEVKHDDDKNMKCPVGQVWGQDWSNSNDWRTYGKMRCMPVVVYSNYGGCMTRVVKHYEAAKHYVQPVAYQHHDNYQPKHEVEHKDYDSHSDYQAWMPKHDDKDTYKDEHKVTWAPKHDEHQDKDYSHNYQPKEEHHNYGSDKDWGNTTVTHNTNNVDADNHNTQTVTSGSVNASHNTWVGDVHTGDATVTNETNTEVTLHNSQPAQTSEHHYGGSRTETRNTNNVSVRNHNTQTVRSGSANVYGNTSVGNITTGSASAHNSTNTVVSVNN